MAEAVLEAPTEEAVAADTPVDAGVEAGAVAEGAPEAEAKAACGFSASWW